MVWYDNQGSYQTCYPTQLVCGEYYYKFSDIDQNGWNDHTVMPLSPGWTMVFRSVWGRCSDGLCPCQLLC